MLHEIGEHCFRNEYEPRPPRQTDIALCYHERTALLMSKPDGELQLPLLGQLLAPYPGIMDSAQYLFSIDGQGFYWVDGIDEERTPGASLQPIEIFRSFVPQHMGFAGIVGSQLYRFYQGNAYCGRCARPMQKSVEERALICPACGNIVYPRISPAVIVGITDGDRLLMTKYAGRVYNRYALVAGFTEFGESVENTVQREVLEEVGLHVKHVRYFKSQPWPFSDSILLGFFCDLDGDDLISLDVHELSEASWFRRDELPLTENMLSLTSTMIEAFRRDEYPKW